MRPRGRPRPAYRQWMRRRVVRLSLLRPRAGRRPRAGPSGCGPGSSGVGADQACPTVIQAGHLRIGTDAFRRMEPGGDGPALEEDRRQTSGSQMIQRRYPRSVQGVVTETSSMFRICGPHGRVETKVTAVVHALRRTPSLAERAPSWLRRSYWPPPAGAQSPKEPGCQPPASADRCPGSPPSCSACRAVSSKGTENRVRPPRRARRVRDGPGEGGEHSERPLPKGRTSTARGVHVAELER